MGAYLVIAGTVIGITWMNLWFRVLTKRLEKRIQLEAAESVN